jgi:serine/threonine protein kinase
LREARHASTLSHPHVCTIYDVDEAGGVPFIVMEYVEGRTLGDLLRPDGLPIAKLLAYGIQVAQALEHAHSRGIAHRDLKAANVVVGAGGCAKLLDFGLARRLPGTIATVSGSTIDHGALAGTLSHMAPEVLLGRDADARAARVRRCTLKRSPGHTGFSQRISLIPAPPKVAVLPIKASQCMRMAMAAVCQPEADREPSIEARPASSSR